MALFGSKKKDVVEKKEITPKVVKAAKTPKAAKTSVAVAIPEVGGISAAAQSHTSSILRPRITEKSGLLSQSGVYTFEITRNANKLSIKQAVVSLYKVTPAKIAIVNTPDRKVFIRGRRGVVPGVRKALVTVKKGDKIDFV
jgi:large subunit ribosomal protein L23